jgi:inosine/xanthosine triphosphate pyrophosphatase family protein
MFIPYISEQLSVSSEQLKDKTLGELEDEVKKSISHRSKALMLARPIIGMLGRK